MTVNNPKDCIFIGTQIVPSPTQKPIGSILYLPLKKEWYNMIESGVKTEEYRELKQHWAQRICNNYGKMSHCVRAYCVGCGLFCPKHEHVRFSYGYTNRTMTFEVESLTIGRGRPEWGAPTDRNVFIIKLGRRVA